MAFNKGELFESFDEFEVKLKAFQASINVLFSRKSSKKFPRWVIGNQGRTLEVARSGKICLRLFENEPDLKMLFPKMIRMNESNQLEWDVDRDMLQKHAVTVMEGLGAAVESLHDSHYLNTVLIALGQTHDKRNIKHCMLKRMWPSMHVGLASMLGDGYTKEVSEAWRKLYSYICMQMRIGMENPDLYVDIHDEPIS